MDIIWIERDGYHPYCPRCLQATINSKGQTEEGKTIWLCTNCELLIDTW